MADIPKRQIVSPLSSRLLEAAGFKLLNRGKVRDTYVLGDGLLLVVVTDRISIFDFVLDASVSMKGQVLNRLSIMWFTRGLRGIPHHLVAHGQVVDLYLPENLRGIMDLWSRAQVVKDLQMVPIECIARGYLTGSGLRDYKATGKVCGVSLPQGLEDGDELPEPIFTPSTKSKDGHDVNISEQKAASIIGDTWGMPIEKAQALVLTLKRLTLEIYRQGHEYSRSRGIILADTKLEFGFDTEGNICLGDEVLTPDSSRNWLIYDLCTAPWVGKPPSGYDKEPVRQAGKKAQLSDGTVIDISRLDPKDPEHVRIVQSWQVPQEVLDSTTRRYEVIEEMLQ